MSYFERLITELRADASHDSLFRNMINVFSPYYLCDHFIGSEAWQWLGLDRIPGKNDILTTHNLAVIKDYDIIACQVNFFQMFATNILPNIDKKIVLITSQFEYPQLHQTEYTDQVLNDPRVVLWFSTNPIYERSEKYIPFPCGMSPWRENLTSYASVLLEEESVEKTIEVAHMHLSETNPSRACLPRGPNLSPKEYYETILRARYLISPIGDRDDCYRHYEAIGLACVPMSNVGDYYRTLFENNMYYCSAEEMVEAIENQKVRGCEYVSPNRDLICFEYYKDYIENARAKLS